MSRLCSISYKMRRITAFTAALLFFAALALSAAFIAAEAEHDCEGEGCHVCSRIHECEAALRRAGGALPVFGAAVLGALLMLLASAAPMFIFTRVTPVSGKVRLNN